MEEVKQSLQQKQENYKAVYLQKQNNLQPSKRVHKRRDTETYHANCRRYYRQTGKYRKFH